MTRTEELNQRSSILSPRCHRATWLPLRMRPYAVLAHIVGMSQRDMNQTFFPRRANRLVETETETETETKGQRHRSPRCAPPPASRCIGRVPPTCARLLRQATEASALATTPGRRPQRCGRGRPRWCRLRLRLPKTTSVEPPARSLRKGTAGAPPRDMCTCGHHQVAGSVVVLGRLTTDALEMLHFADNSL